MVFVTQLFGVKQVAAQITIWIGEVISGCLGKTLEFVGKPPSAVQGDSAQPRAALPQVIFGQPRSPKS
jgi:hypothetical protein